MAEVAIEDTKHEAGEWGVGAVDDFLKEKQQEETRLTHISLEDRLAAENLQLKSVCSLQRIQLLQGQLNEVARTIGEEQQKAAGIQNDLNTLKASIAQRYKLDFGKYQIRESDGAIIPIGS